MHPHPYVWLNGGLVASEALKVSPYAHALHYGTGVFEGARAYDGKIFKLTAHSKRLIESARMLDIRLEVDAAGIDAACEETVAANKSPSCYVRPLVWNGEGSALGVSAKGSQVSVAVLTWDMGKYFKFNSVSLMTSRWRRPPPESAPVFAKATGLYIPSTLARHQAIDGGYDDALLLDTRGYVAESSGANIFLVIDGALHTPAADCFLNGITRQVVMALASDAGITVIERHISPSELAGADEVFLTGTAAEVTPVSRIDDRQFAIGAITRKLAEAYTGKTHSA